MSADPQDADGPDTAEDLAWEARHCCYRLHELAERVGEAVPSHRAAYARRLLHEAALKAHEGAAWTQGGSRES